MRQLDDKQSLTSLSAPPIPSKAVFKGKKLQAKTIPALVALFLTLAPFLFVSAAFAQTEPPGPGQGLPVDPGAGNLSSGASQTRDTVPDSQYADARGEVPLVYQAAENNTNTVIQNVTNTLLGNELGYINETYMGMKRFWSDDIIGNLFQNVGQLIGKWISEWINGWVAQTVQFLTAFLRTFVLNPNIAVNGIQNGPGAGGSDDISPFIRAAADVMYGIAVDLLLLLFILCIWKYWADSAWRGGVSLMSAVGRLIFTAGLLLAWPTMYAFIIQITNEMIQAIYFNSADQIQMLDAAMASAVKGGLMAGLGLVGHAFAPVVGAALGGLIPGLVGEIVAFAGLVIYLILGGILIAQLIYILVLKAIQTALLTAQYMFGPVFLVFFATPDTENVATGYVRSFVEVSLWTFVWVGLLKIMVIILFSDFNPWGKIVMAIGVLQLMIQVPSFLARAQISPLSDFVSAGLITGGLLGIGKTLASKSGDLMDRFSRMRGSWQDGGARGAQQTQSVKMNGLPHAGQDPEGLQRVRNAAGGDLKDHEKNKGKGGPSNPNGQPLNPNDPNAPKNKPGPNGLKPNPGAQGAQNPDGTLAGQNGKGLNAQGDPTGGIQGPKQKGVGDALGTGAKIAAASGLVGAAMAATGAAGATNQDPNKRDQNQGAGVPNPLDANAQKDAMSRMWGLDPNAQPKTDQQKQEEQRRKEAERAGVVIPPVTTGPQLNVGDEEKNKEKGEQVPPGTQGQPKTRDGEGREGTGQTGAQTVSKPTLQVTPVVPAGGTKGGSKDETDKKQTGELPPVVPASQRPTGDNAKVPPITATDEKGRPLKVTTQGDGTGNERGQNVVETDAEQDKTGQQQQQGVRDTTLRVNEGDPRLTGQGQTTGGKINVEPGKQSTGVNQPNAGDPNQGQVPVPPASRTGGQQIDPKTGLPIKTPTTGQVDASGKPLDRTDEQTVDQQLTGDQSQTGTVNQNLRVNQNEVAGGGVNLGVGKVNIEGATGRTGATLRTGETAQTPVPPNLTGQPNSQSTGQPVGQQNAGLRTQQTLDSSGRPIDQQQTVESELHTLTPGQDGSNLHVNVRQSEIDLTGRGGANPNVVVQPGQMQGAGRQPAGGGQPQLVSAPPPVRPGQMSTPSVAPVNVAQAQMANSMGTAGVAQGNPDVLASSNIPDALQEQMGPAKVDPYTAFDHSGYMSVPPAIMAIAVRTYQGPSMGKSPDGQATIVGTPRGISHVRFAANASPEQKAMQMATAGYAATMSDDYEAMDAARQSAIDSGADAPRGIADRVAANWMSYRGHSWKETNRAKRQFQQAMTQSAVEGAQAYVTGDEEKANAFTEHLRTRFGEMTPEKQSWLIHSLTDNTSPESGWSTSRVPATEALVHANMPINPVNRAIMANPGVIKLPAWQKGVAARGMGSYVNAVLDERCGPGTSPEERNALAGYLAPRVAPAVVEACSAIQQFDPTPEITCGDTAFVNQVAANGAVYAKDNPQGAYRQAYEELRQLKAAGSVVGGGGGGFNQGGGGGFNPGTGGGGSNPGGGNGPVTYTPGTGPAAQGYGGNQVVQGGVIQGQAQSFDPIVTTEVRGAVMPQNQGGYTVQYDQQVAVNPGSVPTGHAPHVGMPVPQMPGGRVQQQTNINFSVGTPPAMKAAPVSMQAMSGQDPMIGDQRVVTGRIMSQGQGGIVQSEVDVTVKHGQTHQALPPVLPASAIPIGQAPRVVNEVRVNINHERPGVVRGDNIHMTVDGPNSTGAGDVRIVGVSEQGGGEAVVESLASVEVRHDNSGGIDAGQVQSAAQGMAMSAVQQLPQGVNIMVEMYNAGFTDQQRRDPNVINGAAAVYNASGGDRSMMQTAAMTARALGGQSQDFSLKTVQVVQQMVDAGWKPQQISAHDIHIAEMIVDHGGDTGGGPGHGYPTPQYVRMVGDHPDFRRVSSMGYAQDDSRYQNQTQVVSERQRVLDQLAQMRYAQRTQQGGIDGYPRVQPPGGNRGGAGGGSAGGGRFA